MKTIRPLYELQRNINNQLNARLDDFAFEMRQENLRKMQRRYSFTAVGVVAGVVIVAGLLILAREFGVLR